jgi:hypothetical protein
MKTRWAVCINDEDYPASLEVGKLYQVIPDPTGNAHGLLRVIDESGEDYLYEKSRFFAVEIPPGLARALKRAYRNLV